MMFKVERNDISENFHKGNNGRTTDKIAEQTGFGSGRTYDTAKKIWDKAKDGDQHSKKLVK